MTALSGKKLQIQAWSVSVATHSLVVGMAVVFMAQIQPIPMKDVFKWEVSLVEPVPLEATAEPEKLAPPSRTPKPQSEAAAKGAPGPQVTTRQVETVETVEKPTVVQRAVQQVVETAKPIEDTVKPIERVVAAQKPETVMSEQSVVKQAQPQERSVEGSLPAVTTQEAVATPSAQPVIAQGPVVASTPSETSKIMTPVIGTQSVVAPPQGVVGSTPAVETAEAPAQVARTAPQTSEVRADYRWLGESLWHRVAELKRYPRSARLNGLEGRVLLRAVIRADGHLAEVSVITSSGHTVLDDAAVEAVRLACPLHMKHELGKPQIVVNLPIVFSLAN